MVLDDFVRCAASLLETNYIGLTAHRLAVNVTFTLLTSLNDHIVPVATFLRAETAVVAGARLHVQLDLASASHQSRGLHCVTRLVETIANQ